MARAIKADKELTEAFDKATELRLWAELKATVDSVPAFNPNPPTPEEFLEARRLGIKADIEDQKRRG